MYPLSLVRLGGVNFTTLGGNCAESQQNLREVEKNYCLATQIWPTHHLLHSPLPVDFIVLVVDIPIRLVVLFAPFPIVIS